MVDRTVSTDLARADLDGTVVDRNHPDYDRLRRVYNAVVDRSPRAIVRAAPTARRNTGVWRRSSGDTTPRTCSV
jgi:hypothetical protein